MARKARKARKVWFQLMDAATRSPIEGNRTTSVSSVGVHEIDDLVKKVHGSYDRTQQPGMNILAHACPGQLKVYADREAYDAANSQRMWRHVALGDLGKTQLALSLWKCRSDKVVSAPFVTVPDLPVTTALNDPEKFAEECISFPEWSVNTVHDTPCVWRFMKSVDGCTDNGKILWRFGDQQVVSLLLDEWFPSDGSNGMQSILFGSPWDWQVDAVVYDDILPRVQAQERVGVSKIEQATELSFQKLVSYIALTTGKSYGASETSKSCHCFWMSGSLLTAATECKVSSLDPPGTGKSTLLCMMTFYLVFKHKNVLMYRRLNKQRSCLLYLGHQGDRVVHFLMPTCQSAEVGLIYEELRRQLGMRNVWLLMDGSYYKSRDDVGVQQELVTFRLMTTCQEVYLKS
ncbi:LOW QUALITY PROTEIN: Crinkler (CRN) [Phytophthora megakarya]|uniref:Crinkler (CRN) n=1 Tax=Phytophthora megakarya TaxID=4795 RepID=A0A225WTX7_9STRA|nr:LOW QUALITY PROTEIN: Crinkler (CRN) [Phytophthora megakarya]